MVGYGKDAGAGYYILQATSRAYQLEADVTEDGLFDEDGRPVELPEGSLVIDAVYLNKVPLREWYTPFGETPCGCAGECECDRLLAGRVRVPSHMVLESGFEMALVPPPSGIEPKLAKGKKKKWGARDQQKECVEKGAVELSPETRNMIMDERDDLAPA
jgi:hypothetical protein